MSVFHRQKREHALAGDRHTRVANETNDTTAAHRPSAGPSGRVAPEVAAEQRPTSGSTPRPAEPAPAPVPGTMSSAAGTHRYPIPGDSASAEEMEASWAERTRIVLSPVAAPSILGLFGFMGATLMVAAWMAGWYGDPTTLFTLWPFALAFGGIAQLLAAMWSYRARDGVATAMHGLWGSFWIGFGILTLLAETGIHPPLALAKDVPFAWWFIVLAAITMMGALASLGDNLGLFAVLGLLTAGSAFAAVGFYGGGAWAFNIAGYVLVASAAAAWYSASAMMLKGSFGRTVLPLGNLKAAANVPGRKPTYPMEYPLGMAGAKVGQ
ncbi:MAG TPA: GPR1/FUN34/YaaH family transporter [Nocardioidaceae bacterium]|nr:GPR1/FUN34/YaaH family transporter [Nocardioidaceae bacterium]